MQISIAGKIFIIGEYAVLQGYPAAVAAVGPRFSLTQGRLGVLIQDFAAQSPAGRLRDRMGEYPIDLGFIDPWEKKGGFGASTAQFALLYRALGGRNRLDAWARYREITAETSTGVLPSGADLVAQYLGGIQEITVKGKNKITAQDITSNIELNRILIFSATHLSDRKVETHTHLATLDLDWDYSELGAIALKAQSLLQKKDFEGWANLLSEYADCLRKMGLECDSAFYDRKALARIPGVLAVKGTGALLADALLVVTKKDAKTQPIIEAAVDRGLKVLQHHPFPEGPMEFSA